MEVSGLAVRGIGKNQARLTWVPAPGGGVQKVYRNTVDDFSTAVLAATLAVDVTLWNDYGLTPATAYFWWVTVDLDPPAPSVTVTTGTAPTGGPTFETLLKPLYTWAFGAVAIPVVWGNQGEVKPLKPFVMLNLAGPIKVPATDHNTEAGQLLSGMRRWTVSVHCFTDPVGVDPQSGEPVGRDAMSYAAQLQASLDDEAVTDTLVAAGIGCADVMDVTDVSALLETKFERHAQFDFQINVPSNVVVSDGVIDLVDLPEVEITA